MDQRPPKEKELIDLASDVEVPKQNVLEIVLLARGVGEKILNVSIPNPASQTGYDALKMSVVRIKVVCQPRRSYQMARL